MGEERLLACLEGMGIWWVVSDSEYSALVKEVGGSPKVMDTEWQLSPSTYPVPSKHELIEVLSAQLEPCKRVGFKVAALGQSMLLAAYL